MSNETKQDVFNDLVEKHLNYVITVVGDYGVKDKVIEGWNERYAAALPDALPVIPKEIGGYIEWQKYGKSTLRAAIIAATDFHYVDDDEADWIFYHSEDFARAWLLGVWRVEETGEIVKLKG